MATQERLDDTSPHEVIPMLKDDPNRQIAAAPNRQALNNGDTRQADSRPETTPSTARGVIIQSLVAGAVLLLTTCCGIHVGYSAILLPQLKDDNSTLPTDDELGSWIVSVQAIASPFGIVLSGLLMDRWGRRRTLIVCNVVFTASWMILALATNHAVILTARVMAGFSSGLSIWPTQVVTNEMSQPRIRGILTAMIFLSNSLGILLVYLLGAVMEWHVVSGVSTVFPLLSLVAFILLPESPVWLVKNNRIQDAEKTLRWLQGGGVGIQVKGELEQMISRYGPRNDNSLTRNAENTSTKNCCQVIAKPHILKPLTIVSVFYLIQIISGTYLVIFYAVDIITQAGISDGFGLDPFLSAVVTAVVRLNFAVITCLLFRRVGRRPLLLIAGSVQATSALSVGTFLYTKNVIKITEYEFPSREPIITASILAYIASNTCSYFCIPEITMAELLPAKIQGYILAGAYFGFFVTAKLFPWLCDLLEMHAVFGVFGVTTAIGTFIMYLLLPESRGKSPFQIENYFTQPNILWVGRNMALRRRENKSKTGDYEMPVRS